MSLDLNILEASLKTYRDLKGAAEKAVAQLDDEQLFFVPGYDGNNSIASIMKHVGGNLHSRWTDFLTTDGEKPDRDRDTEFEAENDSAPAIRAKWDQGWATLEASLGALTLDDLGRTITIRGEPHSVALAIQRNITHAAQHVGQIILIAKILLGPEWKTLSIPRRPRP